MADDARNDALINGALIGLGVLAIVDNVVAHWLLRLHRAIPGPWAVQAEVALVALGAAMLALGLWRERRARWGGGGRHSPRRMAARPPGWREASRR